MGSNITIFHSGNHLFTGHNFLWHMTYLSLTQVTTYSQDTTSSDTWPISPLMTYLHFFISVNHLLTYRGSNTTIFDSHNHLFIGNNFLYPLCISSSDRWCISQKSPTSEKFVLFTMINKQHVGNYFFNTWSMYHCLSQHRSHGPIFFKSHASLNSTLACWQLFYFQSDHNFWLKNYGC